MSIESNGGGSPVLSPDEAFTVLGNETRVRILQELGEADEPVPFTELRGRLGFRQGGQFNYHLDKLVGHFIERTEEGYLLRQAGRQVVNGVLSGSVTESPSFDRTEIDLPCTRCGASTAVTYHQERVRHFCTECPGNYTESRRGGSAESVEPGYLGSLPLPPAAVRGRSPREVALTAMTWGHGWLLVLSAGVCPECGSTIERSVDVCEAHDGDGSICEACNGFHAVRINLECSHCLSEWKGRFDNGLLADTALLSFFLEHGVNFLAPTTNPWAQFEYEEEIRSTDPFEGRFTFTIDDESIILTVDESLTVVDAERRGASDRGD